MLTLIQEGAVNFGPGLASGIAVAGAVLGTGLGIGQIGGGATQGIARQPEATDQIRASGIIFAALIEGVALFGLVIALLLWLSA